jgi:excisionase family DNA binding protein
MNEGVVMRQEHHPLVLFVSVPEAARRLGIGKTLLYAQISAGKFPHRRIGGRIVVSVKVLEKLAEPDERSVATANGAI